jgi:putative ABC transport system permease protein
MKDISGSFGLRDDLRHALRVLIKSPRPSALIVLVLALGIGLNTTAFSLLDNMVLDPFPFEGSDRLVDIVRGSHERFSGAFNYRGFEALREGGDVFGKVAAYRDAARMPMQLGDGTEDSLTAAELSAAVFDVLRVEPMLGRPFTRDEEGPGADVVIISHHLWQTRFASDSDVLGRTVRLDGTEHTIVGVMPRGFRFYESRDVWVPLPVDAASPDNEGYRFAVVGRLRDGVNRRQAQAAMAAFQPILDEALGEPRGELDAVRRRAGLTAAPLASGLMAPGRVAMAGVLQGLAVLVLLVVGANVAALLFARGITRQREIAVRHALGAPRGRLVRQILTENLLLAVAGGVGGVVVGFWAHRLLMAAFPDVPLLAGIEFRMSPRMMAFAVGLSSLAVLLFGARPALELTRADIGAALREWGMAATGPKGARRWQNRLVVSQIALSLFLLIGASLTARSMLAVEKVDPGFDAEGVFEVFASLPGRLDDETRAATMRRLIDALEITPGIEAVAWESFPSPDVVGSYRDRAGGVIETGQGPSDLPGSAIRMDAVNADYFRTFGLSVLRGRAFGDEDLPGAPPVLIVNERAARRLWPDEDPIGRQMRFPGAQSWLTVVGVVSDRVLITSYSPEREFGMRADAWPELYFAATQFDAAPDPLLQVRPTVDRATLAQNVRATFAEVDPSVSVTVIRSVYEGRYGPQVLTYRIVGQVLSGFGLIAVLLSALGTYSVISFTWAQRLREVGVRVAFGASRRDVFALVLRDGQKLALIGVLTGTVLSVAVYRLAAGLFFRVSPWDPLSYAVVAVLQLLMAALAGLSPARRAVRTDPIEVLRQE